MSDQGFSPYGRSVPGTLIPTAEQEAAAARVAQARALARCEQAWPDVLAAWTVGGPRPDIHRQAQERLRREWPALAHALDNLATAAGRPQP